jgi:hypothetical protein
MMEYLHRKSMKQIYTFGEVLFERIKFELSKKCKSPIIKLNSLIINDQQTLIDFIDNALEKGKWIQYKQIDKDTFILKEYFPNPSEKKCLYLISEFIKYVETKHTNTNLLIYFDIFFYNTHQFTKELLHELRRGYSQISCESFSFDTEKKRFVCSSSLAKETTEHQVVSGYMTLEYKPGL